MVNNLTSEKKSTIIVDGSRLLTESMARAGADIFIGYPITPANLVYAYAKKRFPMFMSAPDEITTLQWMTGFSAAGKIPVTATSFPGYALMIESINMAYMMELPMVIVLIQRLGPATGTATCGAQGDLNVINGTISGGYPLPAISISSTKDCWDMSAKAVKMAVDLRTPVVLFTSKEEMMTLTSFDKNMLGEIDPVERKYFSGDKHMPYKPGDNLVPEFLPVTNTKHQVRFTASTHDESGIIRNTTPEAINNTKRLSDKIFDNLSKYLYYEYDAQEGAETILVSYGITSSASRVAIEKLRSSGKKVSLLLMKTIYPIPNEYFNICHRYRNIVIAEENLSGILRHTMFGHRSVTGITGVNAIGRMIEPEEIINEILKNEFHQ